MIRFTQTAIFAAPSLASIPGAVAGDLPGPAAMIDGDTLEIHRTRIRLWGIDAPESGQRCQNAIRERYRRGQKAADSLDAFIERVMRPAPPGSLNAVGTVRKPLV
jgi:endonuclease YncB( thermonuclease family)